MTVFIMPVLRLACEILLLVVMLNAGIRDLSEVAILLIVLRLVVSFISRMTHIPDVISDTFYRKLWGAGICIAKISLEVGIFVAVKEDINISLNFVIPILILMILRNISDTWSLLAIELEE